jgi:hypothetical protein
VNVSELEVAGLPLDVRKVFDLRNEFSFFLGLCPHVPHSGAKPEETRSNRRETPG